MWAHGWRFQFRVYLLPSRCIREWRMRMSVAFYVDETVLSYWNPNALFSITLWYTVVYLFYREIKLYFISSIYSNIYFTLLFLLDFTQSPLLYCTLSTRIDATGTDVIPSATRPKHEGTATDGLTDKLWRTPTKWLFLFLECGCLSHQKQTFWRVWKLVYYSIGGYDDDAVDDATTVWTSPPSGLVSSERWVLCLTSLLNAWKFLKCYRISSSIFDAALAHFYCLPIWKRLQQCCISSVIVLV